MGWVRSVHFRFQGRFPAGRSSAVWKGEVRIEASCCKMDDRGANTSSACAEGVLMIADDRVKNAQMGQNSAASICPSMRCSNCYQLLAFATFARICYDFLAIATIHGSTPPPPPANQPKQPPNTPLNTARISPPSHKTQRAGNQPKHTAQQPRIIVFPDK